MDRARDDEGRWRLPGDPCKPRGSWARGGVVGVVDVGRGALGCDWARVTDEAKRRRQELAVCRAACPRLSDSTMRAPVSRSRPSSLSSNRSLLAVSDAGVSEYASTLNAAQSIPRGSDLLLEFRASATADASGRGGEVFAGWQLACANRVKGRAAEGAPDARGGRDCGVISAVTSRSRCPRRPPSRRSRSRRVRAAQPRALPATSAMTFDSWPPCQASGDLPGSSETSRALGIASA